MFEVFCYAVAIVAVLWFVGEPAPQVAAPVQAVDDLPTLEELLTARPVPAVAAAVAAPVAIARVEVEVATIDYAAMTSAQLRKECSKATPRICCRNVYGKGKHLLKEEMVKALS